MNPNSGMPIRLPWLRFGAIAAAFVAATLPTLYSAATPVVAVFSKTMNGYSRALLADNTYKPETYAFADGGRLATSLEDHSIDDLKFVQVAGVVAAELKRQNYFQTTNPKTADLLIFVSFGTTTGYDEDGYQSAMVHLSTDFATMSRNGANISGGASFAAGGGGGGGGLGTSGLVNADAIAGDLSDFWGIDGSLNQIALANQMRDQANEINAGILGYDKAWRETNVMRPYLATARDILHDIEESRYFVVLQAYDFQALRQHKGKKLLWETRYSIPRHGVRFDDQLIAMTRYASQFCGQNIDRLIRRHIPEGRVEVGTPVVVPTSSK